MRCSKVVKQDTQAAHANTIRADSGYDFGVLPVIAHPSVQGNDGSTPLTGDSQDEEHDTVDWIAILFRRSRLWGGWANGCSNYQSYTVRADV
jgi:hypothetical protein